MRLLHIPIARRHLRLRVNYRTTEQIRSAASRVVPIAHALSGEPLGADESISLLRGPTPIVQTCQTQAEEEDALVKALRSTQASGMLPEEMVVIARTGPILNRDAEPAAGSGASKLQNRWQIAARCGRLVGDDASGEGSGVSRCLHRGLLG